MSGAPSGRPGRLGAALCVIACALFGLPAHSAAAARPSHLLLVSIDGLAWDRLQASWPRAPHLQALAAVGSAGPLQSVFPSMTWAAHSSIATGMTPGGHGVLGNRYYDRVKDDVVESWQADPTLLRAPALWNVAKAAGFTTAALLWPQTSRVRDLDIGVPEVYGQSHFERGSIPGTLALLQSAVGLPQSHIGRLGGEEMFLLDTWQRDAAVWLVEHKKPQLLMLHFLSVDTLAHSFGPAAIEARWGLELVDRYVGEVLAAYGRAGLRDKVAVMVVSDHGFLDHGRAFSPWEALQRAPMAASDKQLVRFAINGHAVFVYAAGERPPLRPPPPPPRKGARAARPAKLLPVERALAALKAWLQKQPEVEGIVEMEQFGERGLGDPATDPNLPEYIAVLQPDVASIQGKRAAPKGKIGGGGHGYYPEFQPLWGVWLLAGPGIARGKPTTGARAIDVAPTIARLLGWTWPVPQHGAPRTDLLTGP